MSKTKLKNSYLPKIESFKIDKKSSFNVNKVALHHSDLNQLNSLRLQYFVVNIIIIDFNVVQYLQLNLNYTFLFFHSFNQSSLYLLKIFTVTEQYD